jgi:hypothetical protein
MRHLSDPLAGRRARQHHLPAFRRLRQAGALPAAVAGVALLAAACGGSSAASGSTVYQKAVAYAQCMRSNGEPDFPDPDSQGNFDRTLANRSLFAGAQFQAASKPCQRLLPPSPPETAAEQQREYQKALKFAACMRTHGFPSFPDPTPIPYVGFDRPPGIDVNSTQFQSARQTCHTISGFGPGA